MVVGVCWTEISNETKLDRDGGVNSGSYGKKEKKKTMQMRRKTERKGGEVKRNGPNRWEVEQSAETQCFSDVKGNRKGRGFRKRNRRREVKVIIKK